MAVNDSIPTGSLPVENDSTAVLRFTTGLTGVSLSTDRLLSTILWGTISLLFLIIIIVRLLQRGNAHLRHLTNLDTSAEQQKYWSKDESSLWPYLKKNFLTAPLRKKRHNREMQLSIAKNFGTIPGRLHTVLLGLYMISNIAYCCILKYSVENKAALIAELRGRTGHLAVVNMGVLFLLAARNNPLIRILRVSFDTFNLFHRWIGRLVILQSIVHTVAWAVNKHHALGWHGIGEALSSDPFCTYGLLATIAMTVILVQSPSPIRHAFYETFLHLHQLLAALVLLGVCVHANLGSLPQIPFLVAVVAIWTYDRAMRWARILYINVSWRRGLTKVTVESLPNEACRVTFDVRRPWKFKPGQHAYVYLPAISMHMSHPFSVAWSENRATPYLNLENNEKLPTTTTDLDRPDLNRTTTSYSLIISKRTGMTAKLYDKAKAQPNGVLRLTGFLEGPYGGLESLHSYGTVVLFAGGVGITHQLSHVHALLQSHANHSTAVRKITLIWTNRSAEALEWVRPWMDSVLAMPNRREILKIMLFITKPKRTEQVRSQSNKVLMFPGRLNAQELVRAEFEERIGAMTVGVCGPGALADDVRGAARNVMDEGGQVDFWEEGFTW